MQSRDALVFDAASRLAAAMAAGILLGIIMPMSCEAQNEADDAAMVEEPGCAPNAWPRRMRMEVKGVAGWWYHGDVARCLVAAYGQTLILEKELGIAEDQLRLRSARIDRLRADVASLDAQLLAADERERKLADRILEMEHERPSRLTWFAIGGGVGLVVGAVAVAVLVTSASH